MGVTSDGTDAWRTIPRCDPGRVPRPVSRVDPGRVWGEGRERPRVCAPGGDRSARPEGCRSGLGCGVGLSRSFGRATRRLRRVGGAAGWWVVGLWSPARLPCGRVRVERGRGLARRGRRRPMSGWMCRARGLGSRSRRDRRCPRGPLGLVRSLRGVGGLLIRGRLVGFG